LGIVEALVLESSVLALSKPTSRTLKAFKRWFGASQPLASKPSPPRLPVLWGHDEELFRDEQDLVALAPVDSDRLNEFLRNYLGWFFKVKLLLRKEDKTDAFGIGKV
jgi:hypothetical protein